MVHASMRAVGPVDGGADSLLDALIDVIGPTGTAVMLLCSPDGVPFDAQTTEVDIENMGVLAEIFRRRCSSFSDHASARFAALGPLADVITSEQPTHNYYGPGSPLERFVEHRGRILRLGANIDTVTLTHYAEYLADIPNKRRVRRRYVRADIGEQWIESLDDTDGIVEWSGGDYFSQILVDYFAAGHARHGPVGSCDAELFAGGPFVEFATSWIERNLG